MNCGYSLAREHLMRGMFPLSRASVHAQYDRETDRVYLVANGAQIAWVAADSYELWRAGAFRLDGLLGAEQLQGAYIPPLAKLQAD
jgi:hypothetical protein